MKAKNVYYRYHDQAKARASDDFLGQVSRTINGKPIEPEQHEMIVRAISNGLEISADDVVLDLCCGNGLLSDRIFQQCLGGVGVDFSDYLIDVARQHFLDGNTREFVLSDVVAYVGTSNDTTQFTKALCYGSFAYLDFGDAESLLRNVHDRYPNISRIFIGNLPDKSRLQEFYYDREYVPGIEDNHDTAIGIWRTEEEVAGLAQQTGWRSAVVRMPNDFFASYYRYDAILTRY